MAQLLPNSDLDSAVQDAERRYVAANPNSQARHLAARASLPGGNTRSVMWYHPFPVALSGGQGVRVRDIDGHEYVDFVSEYSAGLYGHSDPAIQEQMIAVIRDGIALGGPNRFEAALGAELVGRFPALERVRFTNSGTEANIMAISMARAITGRSTVVAMREGYHGGVLTFAHGGSDLNLPFPWLMADYNDVEGTEALLRAGWPGNVRQLFNVVEKCVALSTTPIVPLALVERALNRPGDDIASFDDARRGFERDYLVQLLKMTAGNVTNAARIAKRNRSDFYTLLNRHQIDPANFKA